MKTIAAAFALSIATLSTGCPLLEITADAPEVCMTYRDIQIEGAIDQGDTFVQTFAFDDLSMFEEMKDLESDVRFKSAKLEATSGVTDFAFMKSAKVDVTSGTDASLPRRTFYSCDGDCPTEGASVDIPVQVQENAFDYIASGSIVIDLAVEGRLPTEAWTADVTLCVEGSATYSK